MSTFYAYRQNVYTKCRFLNIWAQMGNHGNLWDHFCDAKEMVIASTLQVHCKYIASTLQKDHSEDMLDMVLWVDFSACMVY